MSDSDVALQRGYYRATAATYHERHLGEQDEHGLALALAVLALARHAGVSGSFLDVGAGTGRAMQALMQDFPEARVEGIEPVAELREQAQRIHGIDASRLQEGDALQLPFADDSFDWVVETGVLHHIRDWKGTVAEMAWLQTKGRMSKFSEADGVYFYYSFCAFDALPLIRRKFGHIHVMNTQGSGEADLLGSVSHVAILARLQPSTDRPA
jgi:SAM-dependent methyltransferase